MFMQAQYIWDSRFCFKYKRMRTCTVRGRFTGRLTGVVASGNEIPGTVERTPAVSDDPVPWPVLDIALTWNNFFMNLLLCV